MTLANWKKIALQNIPCKTSSKLSEYIHTVFEEHEWFKISGWWGKIPQYTAKQYSLCIYTLHYNLDLHYCTQYIEYNKY